MNILKIPIVATIFTGIATSAFADSNKNAFQYYPTIELTEEVTAHNIPSGKLHVEFKIIGNKHYPSKENCEQNIGLLTTELKESLTYTDTERFIRWVSQTEKCLTKTESDDLKRAFTSSVSYAFATWRYELPSKKASGVFQVFTPLD